MSHPRLHLTVLLLLVTIPASAQERSRVHVLNAAAETTHIGFFDAALEAVLRIESGDFVRLATASISPGWLRNQGVERERIPEELYRAYDGEMRLRRPASGAFTGRGDHTLNGPIYVEGAEPGDMLEVRILSVDLWLPVAGQSVRANLYPDGFVTNRQFVHTIDLESRTVEYAPGVVVPLEPFWGVIGVGPPPAMGRVGSGAPNIFGGNMDNRDLGAGSTLYLPVFNEGALLSIGDGHGAQGYGEVSGSAVETSLQGEIQVILHKNQRLRLPRAETPTHYMTMGLDRDLDQAALMATTEMIDFLVTTRGLDRETAIALSSVAMDLVVTQIVDGTKGIHALIPKSIFER